MCSQYTRRCVLLVFWWFIKVFQKLRSQLKVQKPSKITLFSENVPIRTTSKMTQRTYPGNPTLVFLDHYFLKPSLMVSKRPVVTQKQPPRPEIMSKLTHNGHETCPNWPIRPWKHCKGNQKQTTQDEKTNKEYIFISDKYFRPTEVEELLGDSNKARELLNWKQSYTFDTLVEEMVELDCKM